MTLFAVLSFLTMLVLLMLGKVRLQALCDDWAKGTVGSNDTKPIH